MSGEEAVIHKGSVVREAGTSSYKAADEEGSAGLA